MDYLQNQHIIPQVYLKQFGYQDKDSRWKVPTFDVNEIPLMNEIDKTLVRQSNIKSLLQEQNIYNLSIKAGNERKLEETFSMLENEYPLIINEIKSKKQILPDSKVKLTWFISFLFIRTSDFRKIARNVIESRNTTFLLAVFQGNTKRMNNLFKFPLDEAINYLIAFSGFYISKALAPFEVVLIETIENEKWVTTDNPVYVKCKATGNKIDFFGVDTEIVCPLSMDYLAFFFNPRSSFLNSELRDLKTNIVNKISVSLYEKIWKSLVNRDREIRYLILPSLRN